MLSLFSEGLFSREKKPQVDPDIDAFHKAHAHMEEIAKRLHASGHHITIDYKDPHVVRHGSKSGTHFVNRGLATEKKIQVSKKVPLRPYS
jgi:hypothetical protein